MRFNRFPQAGPAGLETCWPIRHNPEMKNLLHKAIIDGGLMLLGALFFLDWLSQSSGTNLDSFARYWVLGQSIFLGISLALDKISGRPGFYAALPVVVLALFAIGWGTGLTGLTVAGVGIAGLHGFLEMLWLLLGRIKRGCGAVLILLLLIPILIGAYAFQSPRALSGEVGEEVVLEVLPAVFTAVSAVTVTGLSVVDIGQTFSREGQWMLLILIQLGGLGAVSLFLLFMSFMGEGLGLRQGRAVREAMDGFDPSRLKSLVGSIFFTTLAIELAGLLFLGLHRGFSTKVWTPSFDDLFHAVSAFCNAGFGLYSDSLASLDSFQVIVIGLLIVVGGLGFPVIQEFWLWRTKKVRRLGPHVHLSLGTSVFLWIIGGGLLVLGGLGLESVFWSVTARTAGFSTGPMSALTDFSIFILLILMLVGASPGSTGGGLKTSTVGVLFIALFQQIRGRKQVHFLKNTLSDTLIRSATVLTVVFVSVWVILIGLLHLTEKASLESGKITQQQIVFEATSALGTVGLSLDSTADLTEGSLWILMMGMVLGRIGPLSVIVLLATWPYGKSRAERPEAKIMLG